MVQINEFGEIEEEHPKRYTRKDQKDPLEGIPKTTFKELGIQEPTTYQKVHTYIAREIMPKLLTIKHKLHDLYKK